MEQTPSGADASPPDVTLLGARSQLIELSSRLGIAELLQRCLDLAERLTGSRIGFFHFVEEDQESLTLQAWSSNTLGRMCSAGGEGKHYPISQAGVWVDCFRARTPIVHNDYAALPLRKGLPPGHAVVLRELTVPVIRRGVVAAIAGVGNKGTDYTAQDVAVLEDLASLAMDLVIRKRADMELRASEERLRLALEASGQGWYDLQVQTGEITVSAEYARLIGRGPSEFRTTLEHWMGAIHPQDREGVVELYQECLDTGESRVMEYRRRTRGGEWRWIRSIGKVVARDAQSRPLRMVGTQTDVTERKRTEEMLEFHRHAIDIAPDAAFWIDRDGAFAYVNKAACASLGYDREELLKLRLFDVNPSSSPEGWPALWEKIREQGTIRVESAHRRKDGTLFAVEVVSTYVRCGDRELVCGFARDVSGR